MAMIDQCFGQFPASKFDLVYRKCRLFGRISQFLLDLIWSGAYSTSKNMRPDKKDE
jgi:hypothetical protein